MKRLGCLVVIVLLALVVWHSGILNDIDWKKAASDGLEAVSGFIVSLADDRDAMLVNASHPLPENFVPEDLVCLYDMPRSFALARSDIYLERRAYEAAEKMFAAAEKAGVTGFIVTSGYRTRERQAQIYAESAAGTAQKPGCSEHQTGLAFDVTAASGGDFRLTAQYDWISRNCWKYGFILRYPEGSADITGVTNEPWHYRYVGLVTSALTTLTGRTLEEVVS